MDSFAATRQFPRMHLHTRLSPRLERGVVLFIALMALVAMSLAAVALIRSVDTNAIIAGNLAFRQSATTSGDIGVETAIGMLDQMSNSPAYAAIDPMVDPAHPLNVSAPEQGYYANVDATLDLASAATWVDAKSKKVDTGEFHKGNEVRYIVQRMCQLPNTITSPKVLSETEYRNNQKSGIKDGALCLLSDADTDTSSKRVLAGPEAGGKKPSNPPLYRVTVRIAGPKNTVSYIQTFVY